MRIRFQFHLLNVSHSGHQGRIKGKDIDFDEKIMIHDVTYGMKRIYPDNFLATQGIERSRNENSVRKPSMEDILPDC